MTTWSSVVLGCFMASAVVGQQCYAMDGSALDSRFQPCNREAKFSACCALNGTDGANDICMDSGLCMSTSGWFSTFLWANGCTDPTGKDKACPRQCSFMPTDYSFNILQCNANNGSFCCRSGSTENNCCTTEAHTFQADTTIGHVLIPGTDSVANTTYSTTTIIQGKDKSSVVGGAVGGVLGAALLALLLVLLLALWSRKSLRSNYSDLQKESQIALQRVANEKVALEQLLQQQQAQFQRYQQQMQSPIYTPQAPHPMQFAPSPALPMGSTAQRYVSEVHGQARRFEMDTWRGTSELSDESAYFEKRTPDQNHQMVHGSSSSDMNDEKSYVNSR